MKYVVRYETPSPEGRRVENDIIEADRYYASTDEGVPFVIFYIGNERIAQHFNVLSVVKQ